MDHAHIQTDIPPTARSEPAADVATLDAARLPVLDAPLARQHRVAVDERLRALLAQAFGLARWSVAASNPIDPQQTATVALRWGARQAAFALDLAQHPALASVAASDETAAPQLRARICTLLLQPLTAAFAKLGLDGVEVVSVERTSAPRKRECCAISFLLDTQRFDAVLEHIDAGWLDALERLVAQQCLPLAKHVSEIAVPGRLLIGERNLNIATLESLRPGDVVLRAVPAALAALLRNAAPSARMPLAWGRFGTRQLSAIANVSHQSLTLEEDPTMSHDQQFNAALTDSIDVPVDVGQLDLPLKLEIDTVSLPVAQLSALRAGYVLELPTALADARIRLVTYGQTIGFGELVSVGDHFGVRLVQLQHGHGSV
jgi:type III secretion protein Q